jgi:hypothetical protein
LLALFLVNGACQRSQFATTTRHSSNGKITYVNHYPSERTKSSKVKSSKSHLKESNGQNNSLAPDRTGVVNLSEPEITTINPAPISRNENLIASTSNEPAIITEKKEQIVPVNELILSLKKHYGFNMGNSFPDTLKSNMQKKGKTNDSITQQEIKFTNGYEATVKIISQSQDTLKYHLINEPDVVRTVLMGQIEAIYQVVPYSGKEQVADTRKTEPLSIVAFICSILAFVPVYGIPFALLAIIFGAVSLRRIFRNEERFKGGSFAYYSLVIGILIIEWTIKHYLLNI